MRLRILFDSKDVGIALNDNVFLVYFEQEPFSISLKMGGRNFKAILKLNSSIKTNKPASKSKFSDIVSEFCTSKFEV